VGCLHFASMRPDRMRRYFLDSRELSVFGKVGRPRQSPSRWGTASACLDELDTAGFVQLGQPAGHGRLAALLPPPRFRGCELITSRLSQLLIKASGRVGYSSPNQTCHPLQ
jgi:hypothetical protein